jgi:hypothetical protein
MTPRVRRSFDSGICLFWRGSIAATGNERPANVQPGSSSSASAPHWLKQKESALTMRGSLQVNVLSSLPLGKIAQACTAD